MMNTATQKFGLSPFETVFSVSSLVTVHYQTLLRGYVSQEEAHDFWELIYADKGEVYVYIDGIKQRLRRGEAVFIYPDAPHYVSCEENEPNIFILSFVCRSKSMEFFANRTVLIPESMRYLPENIMSEAVKTYVIPDFNPALKKLEKRKPVSPGSEQLIKNSLEILLILLFRAENTTPQTFFVSKSEQSGEPVDAIVRVLSDSLYESLSLDDICERLHYGKTHLCTLFRKKTGTGIYTAYLKMKISEAKKLIRKGVSAAEISERLRFNSPSHFNRTFKRFTGMTPGEYHRSIR